MIIILATVLVVVGVFLAGIGWAAWMVIDSLGAPGIPGETGSGPCGPADAVNLQLTYADGHSVEMCTRDRPACPNQTIRGSMNGQSLPDRSQFTLGNQLRSSSGRYILSIRFDSGLAAEAAEQTLPLDPGAKSMPGEPAPATLSSAVVEGARRDSAGDGYVAQSGSLTVSSTHGVARGRIEGKFVGSGLTRPDRPAPSSSTVSPLTISGTFSCNH